jgi:hypothetical protein
MDANKTFVCLTNKGLIKILPYWEIDQDIKEMEELEGEMDYTVIGEIDVKKVNRLNQHVFIVSWTSKKNTHRALIIKDNDKIEYDTKTYKTQNITEIIRAND